MKSACSGCQKDKFIIRLGLCADCLLKHTLSKSNLPTVVVPKPEIGREAAKEKTYPCDICGKEFKNAKDLQRFNGGKLNLCAPCFDSETKAATELATTKPVVEFDPSNYKTWPTCSKCYAHIKTPLEDGVCSNCRSKKAKVEILSVKPTDSNKYQDFFNQETIAITELFASLPEAEAIQQLRQFIIDGSADLLSKEAEVLHAKSKLQARKIKYNEILSKMSLDEQSKLRIEDEKYVPKSGEPRKLKSPLQKAEKEKKLKKSLDEQINAMFGGILSPEEIAEKKKALGM